MNSEGQARCGATALDASAHCLDPHDRAFVEAVREHGWFRTDVSADAAGPSFSYTTGMWVNASQPELLMFGLKGTTVHDVCWDVFRAAKDGRPLPVRTRTHDIFGNAPAYALPVAQRHYAAYLGWSRWFYGGNQSLCLLVVWPDRSGIFPWEPGFDLAFNNSQLDLTEKGWACSLAN